jgi:hypothetical protein
MAPSRHSEIYPDLFKPMKLIVTNGKPRSVAKLSKNSRYPMIKEFFIAKIRNSRITLVLYYKVQHLFIRKLLTFFPRLSYEVEVGLGVVATIKHRVKECCRPSFVDPVRLMSLVFSTKSFPLVQ